MFTALHHGLLYVLSFAAILTMFASSIGLVAWLAVTVLRAGRKISGYCRSFMSRFGFGRQMSPQLCHLDQSFSRAGPRRIRRPSQM